MQLTSDIHMNTQYLYRIQPIRPTLLTEGPTQDEAAVLQQHVSYLENLAKEGTVLLAGRTQTEDPSAFGIVILQAETAEMAHSLMENDPAVHHEVMRAELFPYRIAVLSDQIIQANE